MGIKMSQQSITIDGGSKMYLKNGTQGPGKILVSDSTGSLSWRSTRQATFTPVISIFPTLTGVALNVSALPFRHYFTVGERSFMDGGHIINLPTAPTEGDAIRVTNTSVGSNYIYITSSLHSIQYLAPGTSTMNTVGAGNWLRLFSALTIELTFANKNPSYPTNPNAKPQVDAWYVTSLTGLRYVP
jgi:hypothetical protein